MVLIPMGDIPARHASRLGPDTIAIRIGGETLTWGELDQRATRRARSLAARGVEQNDLVTLSLSNSCNFFEWTFAVWKLGATPHIVSSRIAIAEFEAMLNLARPKVAVVSEFERLRNPDVVPADWGLDGPSAPLPSAIARYWKAMSSGGSTGLPKVIVDHRTSAFDTDTAYLRIQNGETVLNPGPLYHNAPFSVSHTALFKGGLLVGLPKFDAEAALCMIDQWKVTTVNFVPTMMLRIWRLPDEVKQQYDLSSLRNVWHMAAPMPAWLKEAWIEWIGAENINEAYAGTEQLGATTINGVEWLAHRGSVGLPKNCDLKVLDDQGQPVSPGVVGEIFLRPHFAQRMFHYLGSENAAKADTTKGFETLGDFGWVDEDGYLYLADRRTDLIISGGANIYPAEIENALMEHPSVRSAVVIGLPHEDLGSAAHAIVQPTDQASLPSQEELVSYLTAKLVRYKIPRSFEFVDEDLRDEAGKVRRSKLKEDRQHPAANVT
jgi:bile acid-coenzyme A ligase